MNTTEATLGATQTQVTDASTSMSNQLTILQTQVGNLDDINAESSPPSSVRCRPNSKHPMT